MIERLLVALLARGHVLLEGLPGLAKTLAVSTMAETIGGSFVRLQFTPDLLPSDLIGTRIWRAGAEKFDIEWGPVFANLVLTDEINRAPAKVQSALLEVMAERQVSIGGTTRPLPSPFLVLATQNPVESEGVYTLPEAQRDRFLMKVVVDYPTPTEEMEIVRRVGATMPEASQVMDLTALEDLQRVTDGIYVDTSVSQYAVDLVMATREPGLRGLPELGPMIEFGVSPSGHARAGGRRAGTRPDAGPRLRGAPGCVRRDPRRVPPPADAHLRGVGEGAHRRRRREPDPHGRSRRPGRPGASTVRPDSPVGRRWRTR